MDGEDVVHVYSGILRSREKEQSDAIAMMRMDLEMIVPSDVHQRERETNTTSLAGYSPWCCRVGHN